MPTKKYRFKKRVRKGGNKSKKYKALTCSQAILSLKRGDCLTAKCGLNSKKYKDGLKQLAAANKAYNQMYAKTCKVKKNVYGELEAQTPEQFACSDKSRKSKLFKKILALEKSTSLFPCEKKHCSQHEAIVDDCADLGEEQCRLKYKDLIEEIQKTKKTKILPLEKCLH